MKKTILSVVGARPNFMKIAPLEREFAAHPGVRHMIVHTGQHYDKDMSDVFFDQLGLSKPERSLGVGSGSHGEVTGRIMMEFEKVCMEIQPDLVIVVGDVNSTIAAALAARKLLIPVAHVEAGLRSFDETMPEELNRRLTDCLSNLLFVSEPSGMQNLRNEGIDMGRAHLVGDIMLETLSMFLQNIDKRKHWEDFGLTPGTFAVITIHRPSNVDEPHSLTEIVDILESMQFPALFPLHPRTSKRLDEFGLRSRIEAIPHLRLVSPQPYVDFLSLLAGARMILSDSGSVQGEASFFDVPCLICRENTERPIYIEEGTSTLVGRNKQLIRELLGKILAGEYRKSSRAVRELGKNVARNTAAIVTDYLH
ncbi:MAG TPA: UDP-N-acetylglucosamine 2-epimerase (non-hydrolyzing) [Desulfomonilaceae bacterium]|nr:UDP-N-acetylglucosamine 2-epimerase (non-hydrolyzing) [Desulfomonilaceae bacterium]